MSNEVMTVKSLLSNESVKAKFGEILKDNAAGFTANLAVMVNNSAALSKLQPRSVISAAVISASLNLPLDPNLGFAAIVPYGDKAQFQIMYKGLIQLAMRSGQYKTIGVTEIYEGELISENRLTGEFVFDFTAKTSDKVIGFAAYFSLLNGFEKTVYWPAAQVEGHGKRYSQTYKKGFGLWKDDFVAMGKKTVLKSLISKWGILSIEMQRAVKFDQGVITNTETEEIEYVDVPEETSFNTDEPVEARKVKADEPETLNLK
jgi:recombination protein RecT